MDDILKTIRPGNKVSLKMIDSVIKGSVIVDEKIYECKLLSFDDDFVIKTTMPIEYGNEVLLPLDRIYQITIDTEYDILETKGSIINRYECQDGMVFEIELRSMLASLEHDKDLGIDTDFKAEISFQDSKEIIPGIIIYLSLDMFKIYTKELLKDHRKLDIVFELQGEKIYASAEVIETLKTRKDYYESHIKIINIGLEQQEKIARFILDCY